MAELVTNLKKLKVKIFSHNDLDGISCAIVLKKLYDESKISLSFTYISYDQISEISRFFENYDEARMYDFVIISDINIKKDDYHHFIQPQFNRFISEKNNYQNREKLNLFKKMFIIDHHKDSEETFRPIENSIFDNVEYYNDTIHCATYQLYDWCINQRSRIWNEYVSSGFNRNFDINKQWLREYIELVNDWDIFLWKEKNNLIARDLNILFTHIRREKFMMMQNQKISIHFAFNSTEKTIIRETLESINKEFHRCWKDAVYVPLHNPITDQVHKNVTCLVIRADENVSLISDMFREMITHERYDIDIIVNISFKYGSVNFRRINENIDLKEIANWYGGGGHPFAAGCPLNYHDKNLMNDFVNPLMAANYDPHRVIKDMEAGEDLYKRIYTGHIPK